MVLKVSKSKLETQQKQKVHTRAGLKATKTVSQRQLLESFPSFARKLPSRKPTSLGKLFQQQTREKQTFVFLTCISCRCPNLEIAGEPCNMMPEAGNSCATLPPPPPPPPLIMETRASALRDNENGRQLAELSRNSMEDEVSKIFSLYWSIRGPLRLKGISLCNRVQSIIQEGPT